MMKTFVLILIVLSMWLRLLKGDAVRLDWNASPSSNVLFYVVHYGQSPRTSADPLAYVYSIEVIIPTPTNFITLTNISPGVWYFSATALLTNGLESLFSNEVIWTNRLFAPVVLRITGPTDAMAVQTSVDGVLWKTVGVVTATNAPLVMTASTNALIRTKPLRLLPPPPGGAP